MQQSFIDILLTDAVAKAVCWTLAHSLWQGLIAALVAGVVILATQKSAAVLRYNLLTADLVLFLIAAVGTFSFELRTDAGAERVGIVVVDGVQAVAGKVAIHARYVAAAPSMLERVGVFLNEHAGVVVMIWMACLLVQLVRMTGGLYRIHRLRRHRVFLPAEYWQNRMSVLMGRLGIQKKVRLLQSGSVTMPVTFGFLKPSILVPLGMLANLPAEQVETILLHELAHIRRSDYLANLLLHIGEAIFFFNPGVRWVAWLVRQEREACCDDLVLAGTRDRNSYFEALIAFGEYAMGKRSMALPLGGGRSDLLWRIRRMLNQENKKLHLMEKTILSFGLMAVMAIGLVSMKGAGSPRGAFGDSGGPKRAVRVSLGEVSDSVPLAKKPAAAAKAPVAAIDTSSESSVSMIDSMRVSATSADPNGVSVTVSATHAPARDTMRLGGTNIRMIRTGAPGSDSFAFINDPDLPAKLAVAMINPKAPATYIITPVADPMAPVTNLMTPLTATNAPMTMVISQRTAAIAPRTTAIAPGTTGTVPIAEMATPPPPPPAPPVVENEQVKGIIMDLKNRGLIHGFDVLSFKLDKHGMTVNGARVAADVFSFFKEKYLTNPKNRFSYSHVDGSTSTSVWISQD